MIIYTDNINNNNDASLTLSSIEGYFCFMAQKKFWKKETNIACILSYINIYPLLYHQQVYKQIHLE